MGTNTPASSLPWEWLYHIGQKTPCPLPPRDTLSLSSRVLTKQTSLQRECRAKSAPVPKTCRNAGHLWKLSPSNSPIVLFHIILGWYFLEKESLHTCHSLQRSCSCMYFQIANLLHQLPLQHKFLEYSDLCIAQDWISSHWEKAGMGKYYIHPWDNLQGKNKQNTFRLRRWELWQSLWCEGSGWSQRGGDDNVENGLAKKREKAEMSVRRCCNEERRDEWRMSEMNGRWISSVDNWEKPEEQGEDGQVKRKGLDLVLQKVNESKRRNSLALQWLGLHAFIAKGMGSIPSGGTKIPQAMQLNQINKNTNKQKESKGTCSRR